MPKRELTKTEKGVLGFFVGALATIFGIKQLLKAAPPEEGEFQVSDLIIEPSTVNVGEPVNISVLVTNVGDKLGTKIVTLEVM